MNENEMCDQAIVQTREVINHFDKNLLKKIPQNFLDKLNKYQSTEYTFKLEQNKNLLEQNISQTTKEFVTAIFLKYCCEEEDKQNIMKKMINNDKEYEKKVEINFDRQNCDNIKDENVSMIMKENKPWYKRIFEKIKNILKR